MDEQKINQVLTRGVDEVIDLGHLKSALMSGRKLRIKLGIDPTSPNLHIGRAIPLLKLRDFQELGHKIVLIIGDSTGIIGDTSDKDSERPMLDAKTIDQNMKTYIQQAGKVIDVKKSEIYHNSKWLKKLGYLEIAKMANLFGLHEFSAREVIAKRLEAGQRVSYLELMYPLLQAYDSVMVKADVELGGTDQRFNLLTGRKVQQFYGQTAQDILMNPLIEGLDGRKMSSSWGNTINLFDEPKEMFGKVMSLKDEFIIKYFNLVTRADLNEIEEVKKMQNPRDQKAKLAKEIVKLYHGEKEAEKAEQEFDKVFRDKELPTDMPIFQTKKQNYPVLDLLCDSKLAPSKNEAKRLVEGNAVEVNGEKVRDWKKEIALEDGTVIKVGSRRFVKIILK